MISRTQIEEFEKEKGISLPESYKAFLTEFNGGKPETNIFNIDKNNDAGVNEFIELKKIDEVIYIYKNRIPNSVLPIAHSEGGNLVCLGIDKKNFDDVFFWDHEGEKLDENKEPSITNLYLISKSFGEFLKKLKPFDMSSVVLKPGQVKKVWIDPDFKKRLDLES